MDKQISIIPLGGPGEVTRNMYLYEYQNEILIVDCGLGFADETMLGVDLMLPDISYLLSTKKRIVGMFLSHGHEDHIGALPYLLTQLLHKNQFSIFASTLTAAFTNEKLKEFGINAKVTEVKFENPDVVAGSFKGKFIRVTHSVPDTSHIFIQTPVGNFYHGSDYKFDDTPWDGKLSDYATIQQVASQGITCLLSDCLGIERAGTTGTEKPIYEKFVEEIGKCQGKTIITTYSSHIARLNQILKACKENNKKVCFVGRSLLKTVDIARKLGYLELPAHLEVQLEAVKNYSDKELVLIVAGSQGQGNSALARIVNGEHKDIKLAPLDTVIFSSDPIPGNEVLVNELIDGIFKREIRVRYTRIDPGLHVSGHGSTDELKKLLSLTKPQKLLPIGGNYRHMYLYKQMAKEQGFKDSDIVLAESGQEVVFGPNGIKQGRKIPVKQVYVDQITGEEVESYILRDRQKLSEFGIVIVMTEIEAATGQLADKPDIIIRGFGLEDRKVHNAITREITKALSKRHESVKNWAYIRKMIGEISERVLFQQIRRRPLVLPIVIEV